jgi:hypothetical protein
LENDPSGDPPSHPNWKIPNSFYLFFIFLCLSLQININKETVIV